MKKVIVAVLLSLTGCIEDGRMRCADLDGGTSDAGDAGCVDTQNVAFPDMLIHIDR